MSDPVVTVAPRTDVTPRDTSTQATSNAACEYCGLPVRAAIGVEHTERFCCLGCEIAADICSDATDTDSMVGRTALRLGLAVFFSMNVMVFTMVLWSWDAYSIAANANASVFKDLLRLACLLFATPVVLILGRPLVATVASQLRRRIISTDVLLIAGVFAAYLFSVASIVTGGTHIYFEVACMILLAVTFGRWLEATGKQRAMESLESLQNLLPATARLVTPGSTETVPLEEVVAGQTIRVLPGERIPLDGSVVNGESFVDQRIVTGESSAFQVEPGRTVFGGTANLDGSLEIKVTSAASDGVIQRLIHAVREAAGRKSRPERTADRLASVFAPLVCLVGIAVFIVHYQSDGVHSAMMASMSVALIACPCALAIATPLAIWAALSKASERGVVFRSGDDLISLAAVDHICMDKTGTMTTGIPRLVESTSTDASSIGVTLALATHTQHPLASALIQHLDSTSAKTPLSVGSAVTIPGKGVCGKIADLKVIGGEQPTVVVLGSAKCCEEHDLHFPHRVLESRQKAEDEGLSMVFVGWGERVRGCFAFDESLRPETPVAIDALRKLRLGVTLLTGDRTSRAARVASDLGLSVRSEMLPSDKQAAVRSLQANGHYVAMVGDGLNDAPSLSLANVGVALGCGVEVSRDAADVCLMPSNLLLLPWAVDLARRTRRTIRRNLFWALAYNSVGIGLAATGRLNPIFAAAAMVLSSAFVIVESLRLGIHDGLTLNAVNDAKEIRNNTFENETPSSESVPATSSAG